MNKQQNVMDRERKNNVLVFRHFNRIGIEKKKLYNIFRMMIMAKLEINASRSHDIRLQYTIQNRTNSTQREHTKSHVMPDFDRMHD